MVKKFYYALYALAGLGLVAGLFWLWHVLGAQPTPARSTEELLAGKFASVDTARSTEAAAVVELTAEKMAAAAIQTGQVQRLPLQPQRMISGRLDYDQDRHVAIKLACDGIITELSVHPGDVVTAGQIVAKISSPEVGAARAEVRSRLAAAKLAKTRQAWHSKICSGVEGLVAMVLDQNVPHDISEQLHDESLGDYREKILAAYYRANLARTALENSREAARQGAIPASLQQQRQAEFQTATAAIQAITEQSLFEARQQCASAEAELAQAQRLLDISLQRLNMLMGPAALPATREQFSQEDDLANSLVSVLSPIDGTVEERNLSVGERGIAGE